MKSTPKFKNEKIPIINQSTNTANIQKYILKKKFLINFF